jgi:hypothetical protein
MGYISRYFGWVAEDSSLCDLIDKPGPDFYFLKFLCDFYFVLDIDFFFMINYNYKYQNNDRKSTVAYIFQRN